MKIPLQLTTRKVSLSAAAIDCIKKKTAKLETFFDNIMSCRVMVEAPHRHKHQGLLYNVRIDITIPGGELVVKREPHEDIYVAIRDAFDAARRQLLSFARRQRGETKIHLASPVARITKIFSDDGFGFLETFDGREIYFHSNSLLGAEFEELQVGISVRFSEEQGAMGPQASSVSLLREAAIPSASYG